MDLPRPGDRDAASGNREQRHNRILEAQVPAHTPAKREAGEIPARSRRCKGETAPKVTGAIREDRGDAFSRQRSRVRRPACAADANPLRTIGRVCQFVMPFFVSAGAPPLRTWRSVFCRDGRFFRIDRGLGNVNVEMFMWKCLCSGEIGRLSCS